MDRIPASGSYELPDDLWRIMARSARGSGLHRLVTGAICDGCGTKFSKSPTGSVDLRLQRPKECPLLSTLGAPLVTAGSNLGPLEPNPTTEVDLQGFDAPWHLTREFMLYRPRALNPRQSLVGPGVWQRITWEVERTGMVSLGRH